MLNENQFEDTQYAVLALQRSINGFDGQISYFTRYDRLHYSPDPLGDLLINGVASDVVRQSYTNGIQADGSYQINPANTIRTGFFFSGEQAFVGNTSLVEPAVGGVPVDAPFTITDNVSTTGISPACMRRTNGKSPTGSSSTAVCASTKCGNS